jgi:hypothetical protein
MEYPLSVYIMNNGAKKVVVTGGSGKAGRACVADLIAHGHQVFNVDNVIPTESVCPMINSGRPSFAGIREFKPNRRRKLRRRPRSPRFEMLSCWITMPLNK